MTLLDQAAARVADAVESRQKVTSRLHPPVAAERIAVTSGGVSALMLAVQLLVDAGDEVVAVTPV